MIKYIIQIIAVISLSLSLFTFAHSDDHKSSKEIVSDLKSEIKKLDAEPVKSKLLQRNTKYIEDLKAQRDALLKEKEKREKIEAAKKEIQKELEALGAKPNVDTKDIDTDEEIIALRKQLKELKDKIEKEKEEKKLAEEKKKAEEKKLAEEKKKAEEKKRDRDQAVQSVKKEIIFLGETPVSEFEVNNNDEYIAALNKQLAEIKILKAQEEKDIQQSIPSWFLKVPGNTEKNMFVRGTHVSDTLQGSIDIATNRALSALGKKIEARISYKGDEMFKEASMGEDAASKTEVNLISQTVVKEVTVSGWEVAESKIVSLDNGNYRSFVLLQYPLGQVYKAFINRIEQSPKLKSSVTALKNTDTFKELEQYVSEFTGA